MGIDKVPARHFYQDDGDKVLQNWFLYEFANILYAKIEEAPKLVAYRKKQGKEGTVAFCVYFAKRMRQSISYLQEKRTPALEINARYIYELYPGNPHAQTQRLLEAAGEAWKEHVRACAACPNRCLAEGFDRTDMFDSLEETGWPTR
jgi:hypothetical protein